MNQSDSEMQKLCDMRLQVSTHLPVIKHCLCHVEPLNNRTLDVLLTEHNSPDPSMLTAEKDVKDENIQYQSAKLTQCSI